MQVGPEPELAAVRQVAELMCLAARTAPKARGEDNIVTAIVTEEKEKQKLAAEMRRIADEVGAQFLSRDAGNILQAPVIVLIGTKLHRLGIPGCNFCGYDGCEANEAAGARCAYNAGDLGIAVGSAAAQAALLHADNRIMYSAGLAAVNLGMLGDEVKVCYGLPLSATGKNPFFDRG
jgi:uncharacterized ferredoxin-like protein